MEHHILVIDVVGLRHEHVRDAARAPHLTALAREGALVSMETVFPALTLPVQASLTTGIYPQEHGVVANGFYFPQNHEVAFWEQSTHLVRAEKLWERLKKRNRGLKTALLFCQNSLFSSNDAVITPKPLHTDDGLIQWCYSKPVGLYEEIAEKIGEFHLFSFWGPFASITSSQWIARCAVETLDRIRPNVMLVYLPHLDYTNQKDGPWHEQVWDEVTAVDREVGVILEGVDDLGLRDRTTVLVLTEYPFHAVYRAIPLNLVLKEHGLLRTRVIKGREYLDMELSPAFAMVDHQVAHIYIKQGHERKARQALEATGGIDLILDRQDQQAYRIAHPDSGDLIAVSRPDAWFSYYWWDDHHREPDFAGHVDIHRKPGYDPLEMFLDPKSRRISQDTSLIKGSHGAPPSGEEDLLPLIVNGPGASLLGNRSMFHLTELSGVIEEMVLRGQS